MTYRLPDHLKGKETIEGLPANLATVPAGPSGPDDPFRQEKRDAWEEWSWAIRAHRAEILQDVLRYPELEIVEKRRCANDPAYFIAMYGYLFEPRNNNGRGGYNPWIPFERQIQMIRWVTDAMQSDDETADGVLSKCRDVGASWMMCGIFLWMWLYVSPFNGLLVSWKEAYVDSRQPRSLFWKIDKLIQYMPPFLRPVGFSPTRNRIKLFLENPENGNTIGGEATTSNSGRGDRVTAVLFDEAAQIPDFLNIWMGTADSTEHRFAVSTESMDNGSDFIDLRTGIDAEYHPSVFTIDWWEHPLHDDAWYQKQEKRYAADPDAFRREILRDPYTATHFVYPTVREKMPLPDLVYVQGNPLFVGIDPGFEDNTAIVWIQFNVAEQRYELLNGYTNEKMYAAFYGPLLSGSRFDKNGVELVDVNGVSIDGEWAYTEREMELMEWVKSIGGHKAKFIGDMYGNNKNGASADTWYSVWVRDHGIAINRDRLPDGKVAAHRMKARTHTGRRGAMRWILPKLVFADTIGARQALLALSNNSFAKPTASGRINESGMFRDKTTHFTSAIEYWAVNLQMQDELLRGYGELAKRNEANNTKETPHKNRYGVARTQLREIA